LKGENAWFGRRRTLVRDALVIVQVALSCVFLIGAGLLFRSARHVASVDPGFEPDRVVVASFPLEDRTPDPGRAARFYEELLRGARTLPGTERAALADFVPMGGHGRAVVVSRAGEEMPAPDESSPGADAREVLRRQGAVPAARISEDYFAAVGQPRLRGRDFTVGDAPGAPRVAIVNEALARRLWPDADPVGQRLGIGDASTDSEVVGLVRDARFESFGDAIGPLVFLPVRQWLSTSLTLHVRSSAPPSDTQRAIRRLAGEIDVDVPMGENGTLRDALAFSLAPLRALRGLLGVAATIGLVLAAGGLYGLVAYTVHRPFREIGIRVALGATRGQVFRTIVGRAVRLTSVGVVAGLALALAAVHLLAAVLYGISPTDPLTFGGVAVLLVLVTLAAGYAAARRGLRIDPAVVLRRE
jgi:predicted permease